ncbi:MAG: hypothetical protein V3V10_01440, partial [Planctomycetota bacterium]
LYEKAKPKKVGKFGESTFAPILQKLPRLKDKLKALDIPIDDLDGKFYSIDDYHIEERNNFGLSCRIYAGDSWNESFQRGSSSLDDRYVAVEVSRNGLTGVSKRWHDSGNDSRSGGSVTRSDKYTGRFGNRGPALPGDAAPKLLIKYAERELNSYMQVAISYHLHNPKTKIRELNSLGSSEYVRWWNSTFPTKPRMDDWRSWPDGLDRSSINIKWLRRDGSLTLNAKVADKDHPLFLHAVVDVSAIRDTYIILDELPDGKADIESNTEWVVAAEDESVFIARRAEAKALHTSIAKTLMEYMKKPDAEPIHGSLDDDELCKRIGYVHSSSSLFESAHILLRTQLFGDVEISI